jgi:putative transcriptional regulator
MKSRSRKSLFERLEQGLQEGIAQQRDELTLRTVEIPEEPPEIDAETLTAIRREAAMSQAVFAKMLNVSPRTLQSWEQGDRNPSDASRRLIHVFIEAPELLCRITGLPEVQLTAVVVEDGKTGRRRVVVKKSARARKATR